MAAPFKEGTPYKASGVVNVSKGWDIEKSHIHPKRRQEALSRQNGELHDGTHYLKFFCSETSISIGLSGKTAQAAKVRDFYAHNIRIPPVTVKGESLNQEDYGNLVEFVRQSQFEGVTKNQLLRLRINDSNMDVNRPKAKPMIRGGHLGLEAEGYIRQIKRQHKRWVYAPEFEFEFIMVRITHGIFQEKISEAPIEKSWAQILAKLEEPQPSVIEKTVPKATEIVSETIHDVVEGLNKIF